MSSIKPKKGKCVECEQDAPEQYLTAKRCRTHYWKHRNKVNGNKSVKSDKNAQSKALNLWFANQVAKMPKHCENCGERLNTFAPWGARAYVAHILPKRHFESVKIHPLNRMYFCIQCHTNLDNQGEQFALRMSALPLLLERYVQFMHLLHTDEIRHLPPYLLALLNNI